METTPVITHMPMKSISIAEPMGCKSPAEALGRGISSFYSPSSNFHECPELPQRKLEGKYSRISDNYQTLDQIPDCMPSHEVTKALAKASLESSNLIVGIDFTKSNEWTGARSFNRRSLHDIGNDQNPYEQAISIIGKTLSAFDEDNLIPCFGFGDANFYQDSRSSYSSHEYPELPQPKLERRYSRIADNYQTLEQVTDALAEAGLESSNLIVGIDFTKSNEWTGARSFNGRSLHDIGNGQNPYEQEISIIGKIISEYDEHKLFTCFGFGGGNFYQDSLVSLCKVGSSYSSFWSALDGNSDHHHFSSPLCGWFNTKRSGENYTCSEPGIFCKKCWTWGTGVPAGGGCWKTKQSKPKASSKATKNCNSNNEGSSFTTEVASTSTSTIQGIRHSLEASKKKFGNSSSNSFSAPYQKSNSGSEIILKLGQLVHNEVEMSVQRIDEQEDMEMLANPREITGQTGWFSRAKSIAKWPSDLCNRVRSYFAPRSHQDNATEMSITTTTISNGSSEDPEQGNITEIPQNPQLNHSPKHFGMFIFFFVVNLVLAHVRDTYNDSSSSSAAKANWHSYYFGGTITVSFISTLCANILAKYEKPARILEKIGIMFGASGFIMAMVELLLPNMMWIAWIATPIVWIAVILG